NNKNKEIGGFRDTLIWNLWINYLEENHFDYKEIIIINQDTDFVDEGKLHSELVDDLDERNIPYEKITILSNIKELAEIAVKYVKDNETNLDVNIHQLERKQIQIIDELESKEILELVTSKLNDMLEEENEPTIDYIGRTGKIKTNVAGGTRDDYYVYFTSPLEVSVSYFLKKQEAYLISENAQIVDFDWNDWVMHVMESFIIELGCEAQINFHHDIIEESNIYIESELKPLDEDEFNKETLISD